MTGIRVAAWQACSQDLWEHNRPALAEAMADAADNGVQLLVLPENVAAFGPGAALKVAAQTPEIVDWLAAQAQRHGLVLVAGTLPAPLRPDGSPVPNGRVRSATWVFAADGSVLGRYDKRHLFDVDVADSQGRYLESLTYEPGDALDVIATPFGAIGVLTCYDLRFPLQAARLRDLGADLLVVPAAFTAVTGEAHWQVLLRARAIENQCLVIGAGQGGRHSPTRVTWGHSQIVDAWGQVLAERSESGPGLVTACWDRQQQQRWRLQMPVHAHRRDQPA